MGLPYNPSSFASNKTILEAIEELKQYLAKNPLTSIFGTDRHWTSTTLPIEYILNPQNRDISLGDIVLSGNSYGTIIDVGDTDVEVNWWEQFGEDITSMSLQTDTTDTEVIDAPATFTDWIYRYSPRGATQYRRGTKYKIRITYTDINSNTVNYDVDLPIQSTINAIWYYTESDGSKTIYVDTTLGDNTFVVSNFNIPKGADGTNGQNGVSVVGATIDGSNHLILTLSDGNTIDAGALPTPNEYTHSVSISSSSGTFTDSDFAKLGYGDSTIVYTDTYSVSTVYKLKLETASILEFEAIDAASRTNLKLIDVNKTTKAYSMTAISMITSSTISSGTATSGKVLTANGSGGCSWENASASSIEGTSVKSTGESSGKVLTSDGSGNASWQTAGGGTTLTQYNYTGSTWSSIYNILKNSKGNVEGYIFVKLSDSNTTYIIPVGDFGIISNTNNTELHTNLLKIGSGGYMGIITATINSSGSITSSSVFTIGFDNTVSNGNISVSQIAGCNIIYYNDTQLHT